MNSINLLPPFEKNYFCVKKWITMVIVTFLFLGLIFFLLIIVFKILYAREYKKQIYYKNEEISFRIDKKNPQEKFIKKQEKFIQDSVKLFSAYRLLKDILEEKGIIYSINYKPNHYEICFLLKKEVYFYQLKKIISEKLKELKIYWNIENFSDNLYYKSEKFCINL